MNTLYRGNCLDIMSLIEDNSIDLIYTDLPYGTTTSKWDSIIDYKKLWQEYERIVKDNGIIALHSTQPFTTKLINSNEKLWRYNWYWKKSKSRGGNFMNAKNSPIKVIEAICVFSKNKVKHAKFPNRMRYYPQDLIEYNKIVNGDKKQSVTDLSNTHNFNRPSHVKQYVRQYTNYPCNLLEYDHQKYDIGSHPTQKPLLLAKYIISTYTQVGDTVLDSCMGSGTIPLAAKLLNRNYIGIELTEEWFDKSVERLKDSSNLLFL